MSESLPSYSVGTIIGVNNNLDGCRHLALVIDQESVKEWIKKETIFFGWVPSENLDRFVIVRILGRGTFESLSLKIREGFEEKLEPDDTKIAHFEYAQLNQTVQIAGPDADSLESFLKQGRTFVSLGNTIEHLGEIGLIAEYVRGTVRNQDELSWFQKRYFKMLERLLPKRS